MAPHGDTLRDAFDQVSPANVSHDGGPRFARNRDAICNAFAVGDIYAGYRAAGRFLDRWGDRIGTTATRRIVNALPRDPGSDRILARTVAAHLHTDRSDSTPFGYDTDAGLRVGDATLDREAAEHYADITHKVLEHVAETGDLEHAVAVAQRCVTVLAADGDLWGRQVDAVRTALDHAATSLDDTTDTVILITLRRFGEHYQAAYARWAPHVLTSVANLNRERRIIVGPAALTVTNFGIGLGAPEPGDTPDTYATAAALWNTRDYGALSDPYNALDVARHIDSHNTR